MLEVEKLQSALKIYYVATKGTNLLEQNAKYGAGIELYVSTFNSKVNDKGPLKAGSKGYGVDVFVPSRLNCFCQLVN